MNKKKTRIADNCFKYAWHILDRVHLDIRRVSEYQRGNQNPYIRRGTENTIAKKKKDKQRSTKHTHKTKDRMTKTRLKTGGELRCSGRVSSSCSHVIIL